MLASITEIQIEIPETAQRGHQSEGNPAGKLLGGWSMLQVTCWPFTFMITENYWLINCYQVLDSI